MKAGVLLKHNIETLLRARHQEQKALAQWCHRSEAWLSAALKQEARGIPVKYLDRIADFFGIATYQLLQPGISALTERRSQINRRTVRDRRLSTLKLGENAPTLTVALEPEEVAAIQRRRLLSPADRRKVDELLREATKPRPRGKPNTGLDDATEA